MRKLLLMLVAAILFPPVMNAQNVTFNHVIPAEYRLESMTAANRDVIGEDEILYWIGEGENWAIMLISWCEEPTLTLAWGYRWSGNTNPVVMDVMTAVSDADPRLNIAWNSDTDNDITYQDDEYNLTGSYQGCWMSTEINSINVQTLTSGSITELGDLTCYMTWWGNSSPIPVTDPNTATLPEDVTIAREDILYWVGEGSNEVIFAVNWCEPEYALAWGYRFSGESVLVSEMMAAIAATDHRFSYDAQGWLTNIFYNDGTLQLSGSAGTYWMFNVNGSSAQVGYDAQYVYHGDFVKFGNLTCAHQDEDYNTSWTTTIVPVSVPTIGITELVDPVFQIYPNPAKENITLSTEGLNGAVTIQIIDMNGRIVWRDQWHAFGSLHTNIHIGNLSAGVYAVQLQCAENYQTKKLIIN